MNNHSQIPPINSQTKKQSIQISDKTSIRSGLILNFENCTHNRSQLFFPHHLPKEQRLIKKRQAIKIPIALINEVCLTDSQIQFQLNENYDVQLQIIKNKGVHQHIFVKKNQESDIILQSSEQIQVFPKQVMQNILSNLLKAIQNTQRRGSNYVESKEFTQQINKFERKQDIIKIARIKLWDLLMTKSIENQIIISSSMIHSDKQQKRKRKNVGRYGSWSREETLRYIAFIMAHQQLVSDENSKFKLSRFSKYVTNGNKKKLFQKDHNYRRNYPGKKISEIAQILIRQYSFTKEEVEAEKLKALQYKAENEKVLVTQCSLESKFFQTLEKYPKHQFSILNILVIPQELENQIVCTDVNYRFIPCSEKFKQKMKQWKYYHMNFEIELTIPSVQISNVFHQQNDTQNSENGQVKGFWISINGDRKKYFSKSQVIEEMRVIDLENKANEIEIMDSIYNYSNRSCENQEEVFDQDSGKNGQKKQMSDKQPIYNQNKERLTHEKSQCKVLEINEVKKEKSFWSYEENLRFLEFLSIYEPALLNFEQKKAGFRYIKVMPEYVKSKTYSQCYEHFTSLMDPHKNFKQFIQSESKALKLDRQSIQNQIKQNVHFWIKNNPMVVIERKKRVKEYEIKQNLRSISDQKVRTLLNKVIQKSKIKIIIDKELEEDKDLNNDNIQNIAALSHKISKLKEEKNSKQNVKNQKIKSQIYSMISLNWRDIQIKLLYQNMAENQTQHKENYENDKQSKVKLLVDYLLKVKEKQTIDQIVY